MIGFLMKKAFWDTWDNLGHVLFINLISLVLVGIPLFLSRFLLNSPLLLAGIFFITCFLFFIFMAGVSVYVKEIVNYETPRLNSLIQGVKDFWKQGLFLGVGSSLYLFIISVGFRFYSGAGNLFGFMSMSFLFWITITIFLSLQYFYPILTSLDTDIRKILRKCFILFFGNTFFSLALMVLIISNGILSILFAFLLPGIGGILVLIQSAVKLLLMKYDYLEENPTSKAKRLPWDEILEEERELVGKRTFKGTIFPWKD